jgi:hypothetical protein
MTGFDPFLLLPPVAAFDPLQTLAWSQLFAGIRVDAEPP